MDHCCRKISAHGRFINPQESALNRLLGASNQHAGEKYQHPTQPNLQRSCDPGRIHITATDPSDYAEFGQDDDITVVVIARERAGEALTTRPARAVETIEPIEEPAPVG